jgi:uncharacterized membrane-anchored protein
MNNYPKLIIFVAIILIGFLFTILYLSWPLLTGKTYILTTQPVDPFDILRGQYIAIGYEISSIDNVSGVSSSNVGDSIYVLLKRDLQGISHPASTSFDKPSTDFIKGKIASVVGSRIRVEYGIEQYFFERNAKFETRNMTIEVKVSNSGQARISRLMDSTGKNELKIDYSD